MHIGQAHTFQNINADFGDTDGFNTDPQVNKDGVQYARDNSSDGFAAWSPAMFNTIGDLGTAFFMSRGGAYQGGGYGGLPPAYYQQNRGNKNLLLYGLGALVLLIIVIVVIRK